MWSYLRSFLARVTTTRPRCRRCGGVPNGVPFVRHDRCLCYLKP